jgi:hypothetical protein
MAIDHKKSRLGKEHSYKNVEKVMNMRCIEINLFIIGRVPIRVKENQTISTYQIKPTATCLATK